MSEENLVINLVKILNSKNQKEYLNNNIDKKLLIIDI
jgi:hypothetical protein